MTEENRELWTSETVRPVRSLQDLVEGSKPGIKEAIDRIETTLENADVQILLWAIDFWTMTTAQRVADLWTTKLDDARWDIADLTKQIAKLNREISVLSKEFELDI